MAVHQRQQSHAHTMQTHRLTSNDSTSHSGTILSVVGNDVSTLFTEDVDQSLVDSLSKVGVFLYLMSPSHVSHWWTYVVQGSIGTDGTPLLEVSLFADDRGDTTG
jgi:hypothetical protein